MMASSASAPLSKSPSIAASVTGWERDENAGRQPRHDPRTQADRRVTGVAAHQAPIGPDGGNGERGRDERGRHIVGELPEGPGVEDIRREALQVQNPVL